MIDDVARVVHVSTNVSGRCDLCTKIVGGSGRFEESVNHYIAEHGYELLHVGQEAAEADGELWHHTVAVLGLKG